MLVVHSSPATPGGWCNVMLRPSLPQTELLCGRLVVEDHVLACGAILQLAMVLLCHSEAPYHRHSWSGSEAPAEEEGSVFLMVDVSQIQRMIFVSFHQLVADFPES